MQAADMFLATAVVAPAVDIQAVAVAFADIQAVAVVAVFGVTRC